MIYIALSAPLQELVNRLFYIKALDGVFPFPSSAILLDRMHFEECLRMLTDRALEIRGHGAFVNISTNSILLGRAGACSRR